MATTGADANWISGSVEPTAGRFSGFKPVSFRTDELANFRAQLAAVLDSLTGHATLSHIEEEFGARVALTLGAGELSLFVNEQLGPRVSRSMESELTSRTWPARSSN